MSMLLTSRLVEVGIEDTEEPELTEIASDGASIESFSTSCSAREEEIGIETVEPELSCVMEMVRGESCFKRYIDVAIVVNQYCLGYFLDGRSG